MERDLFLLVIARADASGWIQNLIEIKIVNVVTTADLNQRIDLRVIGKLKIAEYSSHKYGGRVAYLKAPRMRGKVSLFYTGKMISVGTRTPKNAARDLNYIRIILEKEKIVKPVTLKPKIRNIVFLVNFGKEIDLESLTEKHGLIYEPEQFPGAILKLEQPHAATILLFASGKAVITGLTDPREISKITAKVLKMIE